MKRFIAALAIAGFLSACSPAPASQSAPAVTVAQYAQVKTGMTRAKVAEIMGSDGNEMGSSEVAGMETTMVVWSNPNLSNVTITFANGKVMSKAKLNLN